MSKPDKASSYAHQIDSDSDFNPGAYIPEPTKKRKRGSAAESRQRGKGRSNVAGTSSPKRKKTEENLELQSESESEEEPDDMRDERDEDEDDESDDGEDDDEPILVAPKKTFFGFTRRAPDTPPPKSLPVAKGTKSEADDGSATASDASMTEPESDEDEPWLISELVRDATASGSETESDSEYELGDPRLKPRPGFPLGPGQSLQGPLHLDIENKIAVPASINTYLRDYQRDGVRFFWRQYQEGRGGLLGDDMGLGIYPAVIVRGCKTIQVISFLSAIMRKKGVVTDKHRRRKHVSRLQDEEAWRKRRELPPADATWPTCLIIAPSTVVHNWQREFETWGYFEVGMYNGNQKEREPVLNDFKMGRLDVVLTTFDLARRDIDILDSLPWSCVFVDEVHRVKNVAAKITVAYHQFLCERRFGLTGTTIQNSYKEMWTILDWTNPGRLGTARQWQGFVVKPLTAGQSAGATEDERAKALLPQKTDEVPEELLWGGRPWRRVKIHVDSYQAIKPSCTDTAIFEFEAFIFVQIVRNRALAELAFPNGDIPKYGTAMMQPKFCGKWAEWKKDATNKVLIFTKSVKLLEMLEFHLNSKGTLGSFTPKPADAC
ncbi:hypothetical protein DXG01_007634 [Tephrocybe rancida]|nr:hypothetical protein DXG01_007634 [Tephrocybe rancida]